MSHFNVLKLPTFMDSRGSLTVLERVVPFEVNRVYWIYDADGQTRGGHRHAYTRQAMIAIKGIVSIYMNDGIADETIILNCPYQCLLVEPKDWHTMSFSNNAILLVISSHPYDRSEYIDEPYERVIHD